MPCADDVQVVMINKLVIGCVGMAVRWNLTCL